MSMLICLAESVLLGFFYLDNLCLALPWLTLIPLVVSDCTQNSFVTLPLPHKGSSTRLVKENGELCSPTSPPAVSVPIGTWRLNGSRRFFFICSLMLDVREPERDAIFSLSSPKINITSELSYRRGCVWGLYLLFLEMSTPTWKIPKLTEELNNINVSIQEILFCSFCPAYLCWRPPFMGKTWVTQDTILKQMRTHLCTIIATNSHTCYLRRKSFRLRLKLLSSQGLWEGLECLFHF